MELPESLRQAVERRLIEQGFHNYEALAQWVREQGHQISLSCLKRYGLRLARDLETTRLAVAQARAVAEALPGGAGAITGSLMQLAQHKLCSALAEIDELEKGDMSRLAHAIARLTQAAIAFQRWTADLKQRSAKSGELRGLSTATSQALRNALLGIAPFHPEHFELQKGSADRESQVGTLYHTAWPEPAKSNELPEDPETARAGSVEPGKKVAPPD